MSTIVLFIGDPHIQVTNIIEVELFMERLIDLASQNTPDIIIIAGDLLHTHERLHTIALNKAYEMVDKMRLIAPTYVLVGNHDYISNQQFLSENHWMTAMKEWKKYHYCRQSCYPKHQPRKIHICPIRSKWKIPRSTGYLPR